MPPRFELARLGSQQLNALLHGVLDAMIVTDPDGNVEFMNSAAQHLYGFGLLAPLDWERLNLLRYSKEAFDLATVDGVSVPEEDQPLTRALRGEPFKDVELRVRHRQSDEEKYFVFSGTRLEGDPPLGVVTIRDVTELRRAERRYRIAFATNPAPTLIARLDDAVLIDANDGFVEMTGMPRKEAAGSSVMDLGLLPEQDDLQRVVDGLKSARLLHHRQTTISRTGSGERDVLVSARPIEIDGQACGIFTFIDITELRDAQKRVERRTSELREANLALDAFNYSVSHDLRAPLRGINGFSQALLEDFGDRLDERGRGYLERVKAAAERMGELIEALLLLSRLTRGELRIGPVNLGRIAEETFAALHEEAPERKAELQVDEGLVVQGDEGMLRAVMRNLLENAWKFSRESDLTRIEVGCRRQRAEDVYFVRDYGAGFDPQYAHMLFTPFQRLHTQDQFEGQGIGLATVQRIIHRHGGRIWAEGSVGEGAAFYFTLPDLGAS